MPIKIYPTCAIDEYAISLLIEALLITSPNATKFPISIDSTERTIISGCQTVKEKPNKKWYSVSVDGLVAAAQNVGKVGEAVIDSAGKVKTILTGGLL